MKFFSQKHINEKQIKMLKQTRKRLKKYKVIDYAGKYKEVIESEKGYYIYPRSDKIIDLIEDNLTPGEYKFNDLPVDLKRYMKYIDQLLFNIEYKAYKNQTEKLYYQLNEREKEIYEKLNYVTDEDYENYVLKRESVNSKYDNARRSAKRSCDKVLSLARCNLDKFKYFVTLTFADERNKDKYEEKSKAEGFNCFFEYIDGFDLDKSVDVFIKFRDAFSTNIRRKGKELYYIAVWEKMKSGKYHFHMICNEIPQEKIYNIPEWLSYDFKNFEKDTQKGIKYWKWGKSEVQEIINPRRMSTYISKYIVKSFREINIAEYDEYLNRKKYFSSTNLEKPNANYCNDDELEKFFDETRKADFEKNYTDIYDNLITRKLYNT
ncbi:MAG: rolling circle replication-associated protein [bacterium]